MQLQLHLNTCWYVIGWLISGKCRFNAYHFSHVLIDRNLSCYLLWIKRGTNKSPCCLTGIFSPCNSCYGDAWNSKNRLALPFPNIEQKKYWQLNHSDAQSRFNAKVMPTCSANNVTFHSKHLWIMKNDFLCRRRQRQLLDDALNWEDIYWHATLASDENRWNNHDNYSKFGRTWTIAER